MLKSSTSWLKSLVRWKRENAKPLPSDLLALGEFKADITALIQHVRHLHSLMRMWTSSTSAAHQLEAALANTPTQSLFAHFSRQAEEVGAVLNAVAAPHPDRHLRFGVHEYLDSCQRDQYARAIFEIVDIYFAFYLNVENYKAAQCVEVMDPLIQMTIKAYPYAKAQADFQKGLGPEPTQPPQHLSKFADKLAASLMTVKDCDPDEVDDETADDDDSLTSRELFSQMLGLLNIALDVGDAIITIFEQLRTDVVNRESILANASRQGSSNDAKEPTGKTRVKKRLFNVRMIEQLHKNPDSYAWSVERWRIFLKCSKSTVHEQPAWKIILEYREHQNMERLSRQKQKEY